jgi:hypothetical protein
MKLVPAIRHFVINIFFKFLSLKIIEFQAYTITIRIKYGIEVIGILLPSEGEKGPSAALY